MAAPQRTNEPWDTSYEIKTVVLLTLAFGLVGLDRWVVAPLFPAMIADLHLSYQDLGNVIGALGISWGAAAILIGGLSDRIGRRRVLIPAIVGFSLLSGLSGVAAGIGTLIAIRALMGITEGAFCPTSFATTNDASKESRRGFNLGLQQSTFPLFGLALGPILATQLLQVVSWRLVFILVAVPGLILAVLLAKVIQEPRAAAAVTHAQHPPLSRIFKHRNVPLGMVGLLCAMSGVFTLSAMVPSYLTQYLHLNLQLMGYVTSAIGLGGFLGQMVLSGLSDVIGRKLCAVLGFLIAAIFLYAFAQVGASAFLLFILLFLSCFFCFGLLGLITGPIAAEAAPRGLVSSTAGLIIGVGEIFGGGVVPVIAGRVAQQFGIQHTLTMAFSALVLGVLVSIFFVETAPRKTASVSMAGVAEHT